MRQKGQSHQLAVKLRNAPTSYLLGAAAALSRPLCPLGRGPELQTEMGLLRVDWSQGTVGKDPQISRKASKET